jgi:hypothetical protein
MAEEGRDDEDISRLSSEEPSAALNCKWSTTLQLRVLDVGNALERKA